MKRNTTDFASLVTGFLTDYLPFQRNYSKNTVLSYRDTFKLFTRFLTEAKGIKLRKFSMAEFDRILIVEFLEWLRGNGSGISTVNQRLAALKSFAQYAETESVELLAPLQNIQSIKSAKFVPEEIKYLNPDQMALLINRPDINTATGFRHRLALTLLYDCGCRVQELCDLKIKDIDTNAAKVRLHGKGNKHRTVTITGNTAKLADEYIKRHRKTANQTQPLLLNKNRRSLSRDGVNYIIRKYAREIQVTNPSFPNNIHAHCFRHSKAMHMLAAGVPLIYIRDFLGHEDISTTMIYAKADNRLKTEAINKLAPKITDETHFADWTKDADLMSFLNSLK